MKQGKQVQGMANPYQPARTPQVIRTPTAASIGRGQVNAYNLSAPQANPGGQTPARAPAPKPK